MIWVYVAFESSEPTFVFTQKEEASAWLEYGEAEAITTGRRNRRSLRRVQLVPDEKIAYALTRILQ